MDDVGSVVMLEGYDIFVGGDVFEVVGDISIVVVEVVGFDYFILEGCQ